MINTVYPTVQIDQLLINQSALCNIYLDASFYMSSSSDHLVLDSLDIEPVLILTK